MPYTLDGYPYDPEGWKHIQNATWQSSKIANNFLAKYGERRHPGIVGAMEKYGEKFISILTATLSAAATSAGLSFLVPTINSLSTMGTRELQKKMNSVLGRLAEKNALPVGEGLPIFYPEADLAEMVSEFFAMPEYDRTIVMHHVFNRWIWQSKPILKGQYISKEEKKTYTTVVLALSAFPSSKAFHVLNKAPGGNEFFAGDGFPIFVSYMVSPEHRNKKELFGTIGKAISILKLTTDKTEFDSYFETVPDNPTPTFRQSGIGYGAVSAILAGLLLSKIGK